MLTKEQKAKVKAGYAQVWDTDRMLNYCCGKVAEIAEFSDGSFIPVDKEHIKKDFCFGYSLSRYDSESYDTAGELADNARKSISHFINENMKEYERTLDALKERDFTRSCYCYSDCIAVIMEKPYMSQTGTLLKGLSFMSICDIIDAFGGSCFIEELPGKDFVYRDHHYHIPNDSELQIIIDAYERAAAGHLKKVNAYLKRYGLSKVHSWTYWQDE